MTDFVTPFKNQVSKASKETDFTAYTFAGRALRPAFSIAMIRAEDDKEAQAELVESYMSYVASILSKWTNLTVDSGEYLKSFALSMLNHLDETVTDRSVIRPDKVSDILLKGSLNFLRWTYGHVDSAECFLSGADTLLSKAESFKTSAVIGRIDPPTEGDGPDFSNAIKKDFEAYERQNYVDPARICLLRLNSRYKILWHMAQDSTTKRELTESVFDVLQKVAQRKPPNVASAEMCGKTLCALAESLAQRMPSAGKRKVRDVLLDTAQTYTTASGGWEYVEAMLKTSETFLRAGQKIRPGAAKIATPV